MADYQFPSREAAKAVKSLLAQKANPTEDELSITINTAWSQAERRNKDRAHIRMLSDAVGYGPDFSGFGE